MLHPPPSGPAPISLPPHCPSSTLHTENTATINQQKRKLSRQRDVLLTLKGKYVRSDTHACEENSRLTEEYRRITEHFKDMQVGGCLGHDSSSSSSSALPCCTKATHALS